MRSTRYLFSAVFTVYQSHCVVLHCHLQGGSMFNVPDEISDRYNITRAVIYGRRKSAGRVGRAFEQLKRAFFPRKDPCPEPPTSRQLQITIIRLVPTIFQGAFSSHARTMTRHLCDTTRQKPRFSD